MQDDVVAKFSNLKAEITRQGITPDLWSRAQEATRRVHAADKDVETADRIIAIGSTAWNDQLAVERGADAVIRTHAATCGGPYTADQLYIEPGWIDTLDEREAARVREWVATAVQVRFGPQEHPRAVAMLAANRLLPDRAFRGHA